MDKVIESLNSKGINTINQPLSREERINQRNEFYLNHPSIRFRLCGSKTGRSYYFDMLTNKEVEIKGGGNEGRN